MREKVSIFHSKCITGDYIFGGSGDVILCRCNGDVMVMMFIYG